MSKTLRAALVTLAVAGCATAQERSLELSTPDAEGRRTLTVPMSQVYRLVPNKEMSDTVRFRAPAGYRIVEVRSFVGVYRGDRVEAALHVTAGSFAVYERSVHKETDANYDAWSSRRTNYAIPNDCIVGVFIKAWTTVKTEAGIEFGLVMVLEPR